jgi:hypothetical protein
MGITAIKKGIYEEEEKVKESLHRIEYLKSLLAREEQAQDTNAQTTSGPDTTVLLPTSLKYDNKILSAFVIHSEQLEYIFSKSTTIMTSSISSTKLSNTSSPLTPTQSSTSDTSFTHRSS